MAKSVVKVQYFTDKTENCDSTRYLAAEWHYLGWGPLYGGTLLQWQRTRLIVYINLAICGCNSLNFLKVVKICWQINVFTIQKRNKKITVLCRKRLSRMERMRINCWDRRHCALLKSLLIRYIHRQIDPFITIHNWSTACFFLIAHQILDFISLLLIFLS